MLPFVSYFGNEARQIPRRAAVGFAEGGKAERGSVIALGYKWKDRIAVVWLIWYAYPVPALQKLARDITAENVFKVLLITTP